MAEDSGVLRRNVSRFVAYEEDAQAIIAMLNRVHGTIAKSQRSYGERFASVLAETADTLDIKRSAALEASVKRADVSLGDTMLVESLLAQLDAAVAAGDAKRAEAVVLQMENVCLRYSGTAPAFWHDALNAARGVS
jgi:KaiC/GvpD/RAD55 family RecA-like ATPase